MGKQIITIKDRVEMERKAKNYGFLSIFAKQLPTFYPGYSQKRAIDDILNGRDTVDADILYATCTSNNTAERCVDMQDKLLRYLYASCKSKSMVGTEVDYRLLGEDERELLQCLDTFKSNYDIICRRYNLKQQEIFTPQTLTFYPYVSIKDLVKLRQQGLRCLLSVKNMDVRITREYLNNLTDDDALIKICETVLDSNLQLFLVTYVELNIDINAIETNSLKLFQAYKTGDFTTILELMTL